MRVYSVALSAEYNVLTESADTIEAETLAQKEIKDVLKYETEETDVFVANVCKALFNGHIVKVTANTVIDVKASNYYKAYKEAVDIIKSLPYKNNIRLIFTGYYDTELAQEKEALQQNSAGAFYSTATL